MGITKERALQIVREIRAPSDQRLEPALISLREDLALLGREPERLVALQRLELLELGFSLVDADECPLCETEWQAGALREQLATRIAQSKEAAQLRDRICATAQIVADAANGVAKAISQLASAAEAKGAVGAMLDAWSDELVQLAQHLFSFDGIEGEADRLIGGWLGLSAERLGALDQLSADLSSRVPQQAIGEARDFLVLGKLCTARLFAA